jgi:uncharacterized protein (DUF433 family)
VGLSCSYVAWQKSGVGGLALSHGSPRADHHQSGCALTLRVAYGYGKPCVRGTRLTVGDVLGCLAIGIRETKLLEDFPQITHDDVLACLAYAADRERLLISLTLAA